MWNLTAGLSCTAGPGEKLSWCETRITDAADLVCSSCTHRGVNTWESDEVLCLCSRLFCGEVVIFYMKVSVLGQCSLNPETGSDANGENAAFSNRSQRSSVQQNWSRL